MSDKCRRIATFPAGAWQEALDRRRCLLGLSVGNGAFEGARLAALLHWATSHFDSTRVLLGDLLQRFNLQCFEGYGEEEATVEARRRGSSWLGRYEKVLDCHGVQVLTWEWVLGHPEFPAMRASIERAIRESENVEAALTSNVRAFLRRRTSLRSGESIPGSAAEFSRRYLIEEAAAFALQANEGWTVDAYPGKEPTFLRALVVSARPTDIHASVQSRINIQVRVRENAGGKGDK